MFGYPVAVAYGQSTTMSNGGAALFQKACIGCHDMGGNILQPVSVSISFRCHSVHERSAKVSKPAAALPQSFRTLRYVVVCRNGVATEEGIYDITYYGKGRMPASGLFILPLYCLCN
ncbi:hypothetical protein BHM03_00011172 [Ensete ventricosum]|nr:hypothetical protein BHM03_00011172 [Ensete ventricosum]